MSMDQASFAAVTRRKVLQTTAAIGGMSMGFPAIVQARGDQPVKLGVDALYWHLRHHEVQ